MEVVALVLGALAALFVLDCLHMIALWNLRQNRFEVLGNDQRVFRIRTDFGDFTLDGAKQMLEHFHGENPLKAAMPREERGKFMAENDGAAGRIDKPWAVFSFAQSASQFLAGS